MLLVWLHAVQRRLDCVTHIHTSRAAPWLHSYRDVASSFYPSFLIPGNFSEERVVGHDGKESDSNKNLMAAQTTFRSELPSSCIAISNSPHLTSIPPPPPIQGPRQQPQPKKVCVTLSRSSSLLVTTITYYSPALPICNATIHSPSP